MRQQVKRCCCCGCVDAVVGQVLLHLQQQLTEKLTDRLL